MLSASSFRDKLLGWYSRNARMLPWRATRDPYRIWVSEIMLQQTRVAAVIPYFEKFLARFPDVRRLARASDEEVLAAWGGLGYYSRARNMRRAAQQILERGSFPDDYDSIRQLAGVGEYTAAAIASIAFDLPYAVVDGNVRRVLSRLACENGGIEEAASRLLDRAHPATYNQALMELGAMVCLPRTPRCDACPVAALCQAKRQGRQAEFPAKPRRKATVRLARTLLLAEKGGRILLQKREFWELPEAQQIPAAVIGEEVARFRHSITNHDYSFTVMAARIKRAASGFRWIPMRELSGIPLSTIAKKALQRFKMEEA